MAANPEIDFGSKTEALLDETEVKELVLGITQGLMRQYNHLSRGYTTPDDGTPLRTIDYVALMGKPPLKKRGIRQGYFYAYTAQNEDTGTHTAGLVIPNVAIRDTSGGFVYDRNHAQRNYSTELSDSTNARVFRTDSFIDRSIIADWPIEATLATGIRTTVPGDDDVTAAFKTDLLALGRAQALNPTSDTLHRIVPV